MFTLLKQSTKKNIIDNMCIRDLEELEKITLDYQSVEQVRIAKVSLCHKIDYFRAGANVFGLVDITHQTIMPSGIPTTLELLYNLPPHRIPTNIIDFLATLHHEMTSITFELGYDFTNLQPFFMNILPTFGFTMKSDVMKLINPYGHTVFGICFMKPFPLPVWNGGPSMTGVNLPGAGLLGDPKVGPSNFNNHNGGGSGGVSG